MVCAAHDASGRGRNVLIHTEAVRGIKLAFQCRQTHIIGPIGVAHRLRIFTGTEGIHVYGTTGPGVERVPTLTRPLHMQRVFGSLLPLSQNQDVKVRRTVRKRRCIRCHPTGRAAISARAEEIVRMYKVR